MKHFYTLILTALVALFCSAAGFSQDHRGLASVDQSTDINIYPNPVKHGLVTITTHSQKQKHIEVYNVLGKQVLKTTLLKDKLNISKLPSGIYILKITIGNQEATRKLVVE
ncbi:hypothetical protein IA57_06940 [Mangrovimonas yunxiaonensis]|uniref:Secretion system C-terminal sorting domain-containing protein n=1 Tax=Mangrovimonas yunxiaonensis TaxID=1197477 RepID=A0A084TLH2_9FLAO|nr:T9SS type A sorting domain-containing protein [Mangrovimonas yunxiaonensis]KFB01558.1 hypothetical protein IA57_06940 [Mangrovimonas yunxiaonensis]MBR9756829.1 T9SS type A sorting domain-containing protein [Algicola sp.]GGH35967.1 hypothetical protein GCM10011364_02900 [Mangrovimonas yunxiaonensis]